MTETEKAIAEIWALFRETDKKMQETDRKIQELSKNVDRVTKEQESLKAKWGRFVEYILAPGIPEAFQERGIPIHKISQRVKAKLPGQGELEVDILGINEEYVLLVETKSTLGNEDVNTCLENLSKFKSFFPEYANRKLIGAVAGIEITGNADRYAYQQGLFVLGQCKDNVVIQNDEKFRPKIW